MGSSVASLDEYSVSFVMEVPGGQDPLEATSRRTDLDLPGYWSDLRRSLRQVAVAACRLMDEEDVMAAGEGMGGRGGWGV
ncbi:UNVERIFIED_CONTAM: hypothetical protein Slati_0810500 [Sesamum latifolium]|uniref:Uncharacterized protein n=1 Tax=Sesamum latifolium TaxID=2727402 RepID=A0AAW2XLM6_9LAMI